MISQSVTSAPLPYVPNTFFSYPSNELPKKSCYGESSEVQPTYAYERLKSNYNDSPYNTLSYEYTKFYVATLPESIDKKLFNKAQKRLKSAAERTLKLGYKYCTKKVSQSRYENIKIKIENVYNKILLFQNYISTYKLPQEEKQSLQSYREALLSLSYDLIFLYDNEIESLVRQLDERFKNID